MYIYIYISRLYSKYFYLAFQDISLKLYKIMMVFLTAYLGGGKKLDLQRHSVYPYSLIKDSPNKQKTQQMLSLLLKLFILR